MLKALARLRISEFPDEVPPASVGRSKPEILLGRSIWDEIAGRTVLDFGCGPGLEAVEMERAVRRHRGHLYSNFPFSHLVFPDAAVVRCGQHSRPAARARFSKAD